MTIDLAVSESNDIILAYSHTNWHACVLALSLLKTQDDFVLQLACFSGEFHSLGAPCEQGHNHLDVQVHFPELKKK